MDQDGGEAAGTGDTEGPRFECRPGERRAYGAAEHRAHQSRRDEKPDEAELRQELQVVVVSRRPCQAEPDRLVTQQAGVEVAQADAEQRVRRHHPNGVVPNRHPPFRRVVRGHDGELLDEPGWRKEDKHSDDEKRETGEEGPSPHAGQPRSESEDSHEEQRPQRRENTAL